MTEKRKPDPAAARRHLSDTARLSMGLVVAQGATAIALAVVARNVGVSDFGILMSVAGAASILVDCLDFGSSSRIIPHPGEDVEKARSEVLGTKARIAVATMAIGIVLVALYSVSVWIVVAGLSVAFAGTASLNQAHYIYLRSQPSSAAAALVTASERIIALLVIVILTELGADLVAYPIGLLVGAIGVVLLMPSRFPDVRVAWCGVFTRRAWKGTTSFGLSGLMTDVSLLDAPLVVLAAGSDTAGTFAAAARLTGPLGVPATAMTGLLFPRLRQHSDADAWTAATRAIIALGILSAAFLSLVALASPILVPFALGENFLATVPVLQVYCVGMVAASVNQPLAVTLQATGRQSAIAKLVGGSVIMSLAATPFAARYGGATGAAACFGAMQYLIFVVLILWVRRARAEAQVGGSHRG